jgi:rubrerythrin
MNLSQRQIIREVIEALSIHRSVVINNRKHKSRISQGTLKDMEEGMDISISKLSELVDEVDMRFRNYYKCPVCKTKWHDDWDSMCDDECPTCGATISPYKSKDMR